MTQHPDTKLMHRVTALAVTRSSALADRPRDALCMSVVSFNSTIPRTQCFIIICLDFQFTNV